MISSHADYRRNDYRFQREQSRVMREARWATGRLRRWFMRKVAPYLDLQSTIAALCLIVLGAIAIFWLDILEAMR